MFTKYLKSALVLSGVCALLLAGGCSKTAAKPEDTAAKPAAEAAKPVAPAPAPVAKPETAPKASEPAAPAAKETSSSYTVKKGDTLGKIANAHKVSVKDLKAWNKLKSNSIYPGQKLVVKK